MKAEEFIANVLRADCYIDPLDERKIVIPEDVAERCGVLPGYFKIGEPVNGRAIVRVFNPDGTEQQIQ